MCYNGCNRKTRAHFSYLGLLIEMKDYKIQKGMMKMDKITREMNELRVRLEENKMPRGDGELVSVNKYVKDRIDRHKEIMYNDGYVSKIEVPSDRLVEHLEESLLLEIEELKQKIEILENTSSPKQANANIMKDGWLAFEGTYTMYASSYIKEKVVEFLEKEKLQLITLELEGYREMSFPRLIINIKNRSMIFNSCNYKSLSHIITLAFLSWL